MLQHRGRFGGNARLRTIEEAGESQPRVSPQGIEELE